MLDESEFAAVVNLFPGVETAYREYAERHDLAVEPAGAQKILREGCSAMLAAYEMLTGLAESDPNAVFHHRISLYGLPCPKCGKPFRTPKAHACFEC